MLGTLINYFGDLEKNITTICTNNYSAAILSSPLLGTRSPASEA
jgi:hypothetical protein